MAIILFTKASKVILGFFVSLFSVSFNLNAVKSCSELSRPPNNNSCLFIPGLIVIFLVAVDCLPQLSIAIYVIWYIPGSFGSVFFLDSSDSLLLGVLIELLPPSKVSFPSELVLALDEVEPFCEFPILFSTGKSPVLI